MNSRIPLLIVVLLVQCALAAWFWFGQGAEAEPAGKLLALEPDQVTQIALTDADGAEIELRREDAGWKVGAQPADAKKIEDVVAKLVGLTAPWPVATSPDTQSRFEVAPDKFQRRAVFRSGTTETTLYLGTSPGFRRIHARVGDQDAIYSLDFANHELPMQADDWLDRGLLAVTSSVTGVSWVDNWRLQKEADDWQLTDLATTAEPSSQVADTDAANKLAQRFEDLQVLGTVAVDLDPLARFEVSTDNAAASAHVYRLFRNEEDDSYALALEGVPGQYQLANYIAEQLMLTVTDLQPQPADAATEDQGQTTASDAVQGVVDEVLQSLPATPSR